MVQDVQHIKRERESTGPYPGAGRPTSGYTSPLDASQGFQAANHGGSANTSNLILQEQNAFNLKG